MFNNFDTLSYITIYATQRVVYSIPKPTEQLQKKSVTLGHIRYSNICKHLIKFVNIFPANLLWLYAFNYLLTVHSLPGIELLAAVSNILLFSNNPDSLSKKGKSKQVKMGQMSLLCVSLMCLRKYGSQ